MVKEKIFKVGRNARAGRFVKVDKAKKAMVEPIKIKKE